MYVQLLQAAHQNVQSRVHVPQKHTFTALSADLLAIQPQPYNPFVIVRTQLWGLP